MKPSNQFREQFEDPLFATLKGAKPKPKRWSVSEKSLKQKPEFPSKGPRKAWIAAAAVLLLLGGGLMATYLIQANRQIDLLSLTLADSRNQLDSVSSELQNSNERLSSLQEGFERSRAQLGSQNRELNRYKTFYSELKAEQEQQVREMAAIQIQKADYSVVDDLKVETDEVRNQVSQVNTQVADLRDLSTRNRVDLEDTRQTLSGVEEKVASTASELAELKQSLEREEFSFELRTGGGVMRLLGVAMSLKKTDVGRQQFDLELVIGTQRIRKRAHPVNEPIYVYVNDSAKPYEILVNRLDRQYVVGTLSIPKG